MASSSQRPLRARDDSKYVVVPDLPDPKEVHSNKYINTNRLLAPETLVNKFDYRSDFDSFDDNEQLHFAVAFKEWEKDFARIAAVIPGRTAAECNRHYYANKQDGRFKTSSQRQRDENKPQEAGFTNHDAGDEEDELPVKPHREKKPEDPEEPEDYDVVPIDEEIKRLRALVENHGRLYLKAFPERAFPPVILKRPDLSILRLSFERPFDLSYDDLINWLRSAEVLPIIKQWKEDCIDDTHRYKQTQNLFPYGKMPWSTMTKKIADYVHYYGMKKFELELPNQNGEVLKLCVHHAARIVNGNKPFFDKFSPFAYVPKERSIAAVRVLIMALHDLQLNRNGFFGVLLESQLAGLVKMDVRKAWDKKYMLQNEEAIAEKTGEEPLPVFKGAQLALNRGPAGKSVNAVLPATRPVLRAGEGIEGLTRSERELRNSYSKYPFNGGQNDAQSVSAAKPKNTHLGSAAAAEIMRLKAALAQTQQDLVESKLETEHFRRLAISGTTESETEDEYKSDSNSQDAQTKLDGGESALKKSAKYGGPKLSAKHDAMVREDFEGAQALPYRSGVGAATRVDSVEPKMSIERDAQVREDCKRLEGEH